MEREFERKIFVLENYTDKSDMEEDIKKYMQELKEKYPMAIVTREFCIGNKVLVRATEKNNDQKENKKQKSKVREKESFFRDGIERERGER